MEPESSYRIHNSQPPDFFSWAIWIQFKPSFAIFQMNIQTRASLSEYSADWFGPVVT
jgi:hypothetical protein